MSGNIRGIFLFQNRATMQSTSVCGSFCILIIPKFSHKAGHSTGHNWSQNKFCREESPGFPSSAPSTRASPIDCPGFLYAIFYQSKNTLDLKPKKEGRSKKLQ
jgi:hypothetical protein